MPLISAVSMSELSESSCAVNGVTFTISDSVTALSEASGG